MYKSKLNDLCQKRKWPLPTYSCIRTGEDHTPLFTASTIVRGITFSSPLACKSTKQAQNEVAEVAFLHFTSGEHSEFKNKLEMYAQKKNLNPPVYRTKKDGVFFRAKVSIDEGWFQSPAPCETVEEAEDSAAQTALLSLSTDAFLENDPWSYKILLQELVGFFVPIYTTFGSEHDPKLQSFFSTVEVEGDIFKGDMAMSKKLAELSAAKAAYTALIERKLFQPGYFSSPDIDNVDKLTPHLGSITISDPRENRMSGSPPIISSSMKNEAQAQETTGANEGKKNYLLGKRFKVFKSIPNMALPEGTVLLPIREDMWTVVNLEYPNEKRA